MHVISQVSYDSVPQSNSVSLTLNFDEYAFDGTFFVNNFKNSIQALTLPQQLASQV